MDAMNGARRASTRRLGRLLGCAVALVGVAAMAVPSLAAAKVKPPRIKSTYVALGDSLAFGYSQQLFNENYPAEAPAAFEHGYANDYLNLVNAAHRGTVQLVNDGCPGETTESLIGDNPALLAEINSLVKGKVVTPVTGEAPCEYHRVDHLPLHHEYSKEGEPEKSQLESVVETINAEAAAGTPVKVISLDIGANDELHAVAKDEAKAKEEIEAKVAAIVTPEAEQKVKEKVEKIAAEEVEAYVIEQVYLQAYEETGGVEPAFKERIEALAYEYSVNNAKRLEQLGLEDALKYALAHHAELEAEGERIGEELGEQYAAEHGLELLEEGEAIGLELIRNGLPTVYGQINSNIIGIYAELRHAGFRGKLIFEGAYDPYGRVEGVTKELGKFVPGENHQTELEPGFNDAAALLANLEQETWKRPAVKVHVCYSDAELLFNVALGNETPAAEKLEEKQLAEWTNMANFTTFDGKANGPDIHATPTGYEKMADQMFSTCGG